MSGDSGKIHVNTYNIVIFVQFPMKSGIFPDNLLPSILL